jgi:hypothetical protein
MANTKKTKKDMYNEILATYELTDAHREFINHQVELLDKKASGNRKPTQTQIANEGIKNDILDGMAVGERYTITELIKTIPAVANYTNQKISALVTQLVKDGRVVRTTEKGKTYFALAD